MNLRRPAPRTRLEVCFMSRRCSFLRLPALVALALFAVLPGTASAAPILDDGFADTTAWKVLPSDGVAATIEKGEAGTLRLNYNFKSGAGFVVIRRDFTATLPPNFRLAFRVRGEGTPQNLECKLLDTAAGAGNVWWVNHRAMEIPAEWKDINYRRRQFSFAWGPEPVKPLAKVEAVEFAVASATGGAGWIELGALSVEELPEPRATFPPPHVTFSSGGDGKPVDLTAPEVIHPFASETDPEPRIEMDLGVVREFGGIAIDFERDRHFANMDVFASRDGVNFEKIAQVRDAHGGRTYIPTPGAEAMKLSLRISRPLPREGIVLRRIELLPPEFSESDNAIITHIARESPRGLFPRGFLGEQTAWTVVGVGGDLGDQNEALLSIDGTLEVGKGGYSIEPFVCEPGALWTWANSKTTQSLTAGSAPMPVVEREMNGLTLRVIAYAAGPSGGSVAYVTYELTNSGTEQRKGSLVLLARPFQVLPPFQDLNITGGVSRLSTVLPGRRDLRINDKPGLELRFPARQLSTATFDSGMFLDELANGTFTNRSELNVPDPHGLRTGLVRYDFNILPGRTRKVLIAVPLHEQSIVDWEDSERTAERWDKELSRASLSLPASAAQFAETFRAQQAYILINRDGPATQPGSRNYERSWIRDGAMTCSAMLATGHPEVARQYIEWFGQFQFENGKVPCVVDKRGPDPVDEHDSTGEYLSLVATYHRFTKDAETVQGQMPHVAKGVEYLEWLIAKRSTSEYKNAPMPQGAMFGLVPESISHEGYSAKPMHSYWDCFWTLRGLRDAAYLAGVVGNRGLQARADALAKTFALSLKESIARAALYHKTDYVPGCVELGDFDATSTTVAVFPCGVEDAIPSGLLQKTFDKYAAWTAERAAGTTDWKDFTPYELRTVGTFVRLGMPERAHAVLDFLMKYQNPAGWRQWAEVVTKDPKAPRFLGDMPHTWCGADFLNSARAMFVYERELDKRLVVGAGVRSEWLDQPTPAGATAPVEIRQFPTWWGPVSYKMSRKDAELHLEVEAPAKVPESESVKVVWQIPAALLKGAPLGALRAELDGHAVEMKAAGPGVEIEISAGTHRVVVKPKQSP
jgi:hypothetical protein